MGLLGETHHFLGNPHIWTIFSTKVIAFERLGEDRGRSSQVKPKSSLIPDRPLDP